MVSLLRNLTDYNERGIDRIGVNGTIYKIRLPANPVSVLCLTFGTSMHYDGANAQLAKAFLDSDELFSGMRRYAQRNLLPVALNTVGMKLNVDLLGNGPELDESFITSTENTLDILTLFAEAERDHLKKDHLLITHPAHYQRAEWMAKKLGIENPIPFIPEKAVWNVDDTHAWTRGPLLWAARESGARIHHYFAGHL